VAHPKHTNTDGHPDEGVGTRSGSSIGERLAGTADAAEGRRLGRLTAEWEGKVALRPENLRKKVERGRLKSSRKICDNCRKHIILIRIYPRRNVWKPFNDDSYTPHKCHDIRRKGN
jgi:hypothetical protein